MRAASAVAALLASVFGGTPAMAASTAVPVTRADVHVEPITAETLKPPECAGISLTAVVIGSGTVGGTGANELVLGGSGADTISAGSGTDCVVAGGGGDIVNGQGDADVLLGGPGTDALNGGLGTDACYGGPDLDTFVSCESETQ